MGVGRWTIMGAIATVVGTVIAFLTFVGFGVDDTSDQSLATDTSTTTLYGDSVSAVESDTSSPPATVQPTEPPTTRRLPPVTAPQSIPPSPPQIGRVEVIPDEYRRISYDTWQVSSSSDTVPFRFGWNVYDEEGNRIDITSCRVTGIVNSSDTTPMGSRNGHCDYSSGFTGYHYLPLGTYRVTVTATIDQGESREATFDFRVVNG